jgi:DNA-binding NarL/FixJ family response regulator
MGESLLKSNVIPAKIVNNFAELNEVNRKEVRFSVIDARKLERECFVRVITASYEKVSISAYGSVEDWAGAPDRDGHLVVMFNLSGQEIAAPNVQSALRNLVAEAGGTPVIVLAASEDLRDMILALDCGARGYVPTSVGVDVILDAARLTSAGGIFLPASSLPALREAIPTSEEQPGGIEQHFTSRQAAVANALRHGKANKTIAYELNMCESTVKVHIRTIMKRLRASNRTEAAFKLNAMFPRDNISI